MKVLFRELDLTFFQVASLGKHVGAAPFGRLLRAIQRLTHTTGTRTSGPDNRSYLKASAYSFPTYPRLYLSSSWRFLEQASTRIPVSFHFPQGKRQEHFYDKDYVSARTA